MEAVRGWVWIFSGIAQFLLDTFLSLQSISIPLRKSDSGDDNTAQFQLDCSAIQSGGQQGQMDCIQQPGGSSNIRTVGTITHKINVKATDDSYQMTQQRMKEAEEERKGIRYSTCKSKVIFNVTVQCTCSFAIVFRNVCTFI